MALSVSNLASSLSSLSFSPRFLRDQPPFLSQEPTMCSHYRRNQLVLVSDKDIIMSLIFWRVCVGSRWCTVWELLVVAGTYVRILMSPS
ncbi:hypothetical protein Bca52824_095573 [Brassica carinata]|uniref:Uncharacterized protein n=1 Tax=Brassica carinata TaxID=52824 RepID=A0A8X7TI19_BRACI|nr:hypothetical protein Bca52824_095573 [Brassica carinata]